MLKGLKTFGIVLGGFVAVLVIAALGFVLFFPKTQAIAEVQRRVEQTTGRRLKLAGDVDLTFWPALGFSARQASLSNPQGFGDSDFISADRIVFAVAVLPLLGGKIDVRKLILEGADLQLQAKPNGDANWTFGEDETPQQRNTIRDLHLDDVRLSHSRISFQGGDGAPPMVLENVEASLALDSLDKPALGHASFTYGGEHLQVNTQVGLPRALLEQKETQLSFDVRSLPFNVTFQGAFNAESGDLNGRVAAHGASLRRLMAWTGSPLPEGGTGFGAYRAEATLTQIGDTYALTESRIGLDALEAHGALTIAMPANAKMKVTGALTLPNADLNPYLPASAQTAANGGAGGVQTNAAWDTAPLDLSGLRAIDADVQITTPALKFQRMSFSDAHLAFKIANGAADARLTQIGLYAGAGTARLIADGAGATPRIAVEFDARNIDALPFLRDAVGFDKIQGHGRVIAALAGEGRSQAAIMRSLHGTTSFAFTDGAWRGVNLAQVARTVQAMVTGTAVGGSASTDFSEMSSSFTVSGGVAATDNLHLLSPFVRLDGAGLIDIGSQSIDMRLEPRAVRSGEGQGGQANVAGLGVPFRISGPWARPNFAPALGDVVRNELRNRARGVLEHQDQNNPLTSLGNTIFGDRSTSTAISTTTTAPATTTTTTTTATTTTTRPASPLDQLFGHH